MNSERAAKRRRIDHAPSPPSALNATPMNGKGSASSVRQASRQNQLSAKSTDVYDDIEGAHRVTTPSKRQRNLTDKAQLDPLRNQKNAAANPTKSPARKFVGRGFFKQFLTPKESNALSGANVTLENPVQHQPESEDELIQDSPSRPARASDVTMGGTTPSPTRNTQRTFEDEIRALEEAARKQAQKEDDTVWNVQQRAKRKNAGIHSRDAQQDQSRSSARKTTPSYRNNSAKKSAGAMSELAGGSNGFTELADKTASENVDDDVVSVAVKSHTVKPQRPSKNAVRGTPNTKATPTRSVSAQESSKKLGSTINPKRAEPLLDPKTPTKSFELDELGTSVKVSQHVPFRKPLENVVFDAQELAVYRSVLLDKLTGARPIPLTGLSDEIAKVSALISQTIASGESNSMLVIGARGSGKTAMIDRILCDQFEKHGHDFLVVRLSGFVHTDDKVALRDIWRQLGRGMELDEAEHNIKNHADTLTTLLAMLSHSADHANDSNIVTKSVIFIMDEFDRFAHHPRQTLLYNLFDIAQSRKAPIAVIGLTTRVDVSESLEKRVKSRFSHRYVHLSLPRSFNSFVDICRAVLQITPQELSEFPAVGLRSCAAQNRIAVAKSDKVDSLNRWNAWIDDLLGSDLISERLKRIYYTTKSVPEFITSQLTTIAMLPMDRQVTSSQLLQHFCSHIDHSSLRPPDSSLDLLAALSILQTALLICAARLHAVYDAETTTFAVVYEEYKALASKAKLQASSAGAIAHGTGARVSTKSVAKYAWDELIEYGLILDDGRGNGRIDVGLEEIGMSSVDLGQWRKWCKEI